MSSHRLFGQFQLSGQLFDGADSTSVAMIDVYLSPGNKEAKSDQSGQFQFGQLSPGTYQLIVYPYQYKAIQKEIQITDQDVYLDLWLEENEINLSTVEVRGGTGELFGTKKLLAVEGMAIYASKKSEVVLLENMTANLAANNSRQIYAQVAGLNIYESEDAGLQLSIGGRGLDPNRTASFNTRQNGYDISADVLGYPESYYSPPAEALREIRIIRGAASLQYGTQFGGLIDFQFKKPNPEKPIELVTRQSIGRFQLFTSFNSLSGTIGKLSYYTFFNYKRGDGFRANSGFESKNYFGHINYQFSERTAIALEYTKLDYLAQQAGGLTDAQFYDDPDFSNRTRNWFAVDWNLFSAKLQHQFSERTRLSIQAFGLDAERNAVGFRTNRVSQTDDLAQPRDLLKNTFQNWGVEPRFLHRYTLLNQPAILLLGAKYYQSSNTAIQGPGTNESGPDFALDEAFPFYQNQSDFRFPNQNLAFFGEHIFNLSPKWVLTPGFRFELIDTESQGTYRKIDFNLAGNPIQDQTFEDNRALERQFLLLGLGASFKPKDEKEFYVNFSENYRSVTFNDIRVVNPSFQIDPNIKDESGFTGDIGFRGRMGQLNVDIGYFFLKYNDRLGEVLRAETRQNADGSILETGRVVRFRGNIGDAFIHGMESMVDWNWMSRETKRGGAIQSNLFVNLAFTQSNYLSSEIAGVEGKQVEFIPPINLKSGIRFGLDQLLASIQWTYLSDQFTDASNAPQDRLDNQSGIIGAIPAYHILDFSMSYTYKWLKIESGVNNVLNKRYFTRRATGYPGPGIIPAAPISGYLTLQCTL